MLCFFYLQNYYPSIDLAKDAVRRGEAWGAVHFTENFTDALVARIALGKESDEETLNQSEIRVWLDMSSKASVKFNSPQKNAWILDQQIGIILQRDLQLTYQNFTKDLLRDCDQNEGLAEVPISFKQPIYGSNQPSFTDFVAPGVILT